MKSALAHFQTLPHKDATRQLHHAFQENENKPFIIHPSSFILFTMLGSTLSNDPLSDKRFDFQFVNPPYGYEWSKDYDDAVSTREPMQNNPSGRQRPGQCGSMSSNQSGEGEIRHKLIETDLVDCMAALPGQLFYSMGEKRKRLVAMLN